MITQDEVCTAIDTERDYQDHCVAQDPTRHDGNVDSTHTVGNYCTMLQHYVNVSYAAPNADILHGMRKLAAIAVHCMEDHGLRVKLYDGRVSHVAKPTRAQVYAGLSLESVRAAYEERDCPACRVDPNVKTPHDYIWELDLLQRQLVAAWTMHAGHDKALELMPHVAYLAIRCLQDHGAPPRVWQQP